MAMRKDGEVEHYVITVDAERQIVQLWLAPDMANEEHAKARQDLLAACRAHGIRRILIDATQLAEKPTTSQLFEFASGWAALLRQSPVVVAGVLPRDAAARQRWRFGEDVAINRGLISHAFESLEEARTWLATW
jgi:hypothetical protein